MADKLRETKEKLEKWVNDPSSKAGEIAKWERTDKRVFEKIARKLVESQVKKTAGFEGGTGEFKNISYGLVKLKKAHPIGWPCESGIVVIFEKGLETAIIGSRVGVIGFGISPLTKELVGISFFDDSPSFVEQQLKGDGGFYFGSTEYTIPENIAGGGYNHFVVPTGKEYYKYFEITKRIWRDYLASVNSV